MSLRARIFFVFAAAVVTGFALLAWWITGDLRYRYGESFEEVMVDSSRLLAEQLAADWSAPPESRFLALQDATLHLAQQRFRAPIYSVVKTRADIRIYVTDGAGRLLFDSRPGSTPGEDYSQWRDIALTLRGEYGARTTRELLAGDDGAPVGASVSYVAAPILVDGARVGIVSLGKPQTNIERFIDSARRNLVLAVLLASALAIALALLLYNWVSRPLQSLVEYAQAIGAGHEARLPELGDNEIGRAGAAIEAMRRALIDKQYVEGYVQSLTHEVKSPLTAIRASAELLAGELTPGRRAAFVATIEREVDRLNRLADRLLELASLERADHLAHVEPVALHALVAEAAAAAAPVAEARGITLAQQLAGRDGVRGDALLLREALDNLLRNALDFAPRDSTVTLDASADADGVWLGVTDQALASPNTRARASSSASTSLPRREAAASPPASG
ncbi:MAG: two-component system sensor histidine kinase CreC [Steroidobacteraceae bacterium]